jgi:hypothetical protein
MNFRSVGVAAFSAIMLSTVSAGASTWPDSIFDGADPAVISVVKAHHDLVNDAEQHIYFCTKKSERRDCSINQYQFILDYVAAFYNDHNSQKNVEFDFSEQASGFGYTVDLSAPTPGILPNPIQSCAWSLAIMQSGGSGVEPTDSNEVDINCNGLSEDARDAATARSRVIDQEILAHIAKGDDPSAVIDGN